MVQEIIAATGANETEGTPSKEVRMIGWLRPKEGFLKLNMDGSYREDLAQASVGDLLRDEFGKWITRFMENLGQCASLMAEI